MLGFLLTVLLFLGGIGVIAGIAFKRAYNKDRDIPGGPSYWLILLSIPLFVLAILALGIREIPAGHVGVITQFGKVQEGTIPAGISYVPPILNTVIVLDTRVQVYTFENIEGATRDLQAVNMTGAVNFRINQNTAWQLFRDVGSDYSNIIFKRPAETALKTVTPRFNATEIIGKRDEVAKAATAILESQVSRYGVSVEAFYVSNIGLNQAFLDSVEQKQIAEQETLRAKQLVQKATEEANARIEAAKGDAQAAIERARGEAEANRLIAESLTESVLLSRYIDKIVDNIQIMLVPAGQNTLLDLKSLLQQGQ